MKKTNRLIDFFAVVGPDKQFTINDPDIERGGFINSIHFFHILLNNQIFRKKYHEFRNHQWIF